MAAALTEHAVPSLEADAAGVAPGDEITREAVVVIAGRTGADRSDHRPTALEAMAPAVYDAVIAMDVYVARAVIAWVRPDRPLYIWNVRDPYLRTQEVYDTVADTIEQLIATTFLHDGKPTEVWLRVLPDADPVTRLRAKLARWQEDVDNVSPSYSRGIATTAASELELLLKALLTDRLGHLGIALPNLLTEVHYNGTVKEVKTLPLGTVVTALGWLSKRDSELEIAWTPGAAIWAPKFVTLRNVGVHDAKDVEAVTKSVLDAVEATIGNRKFRDLLRAAATLAET